MQLKQLLEKWQLTCLKIKLPFLEAEWEPKDEDRDAAWELYVELITRVATQGLDPDEGDERAALASIYSLFELTRSTIKRHGRSGGISGTKSPCFLCECPLTRCVSV